MSILNVSNAEIVTKHLHIRGQIYMRKPQMCVSAMVNVTLKPQLIYIVIMTFQSAAELYLLVFVTGICLKMIGKLNFYMMSSNIL